MAKEQGLLMMSGGIDSTVMAYWLKEQGLLHSVWSANYGQASAEYQGQLVEYHAKVLDVPFRIERFPWPKDLRGQGHIFTEGSYPEPMQDAYEPMSMNAAEYAEYMDNKFDFIEGRNTVFCSLAAAWAIKQELCKLFTAFQYDTVEWEAADKGGPTGNDTCPAFVRAFNALALGGGFFRPLRMECPFLTRKWDKSRIVKEGRRLRVDLSATYSCEFFPACGFCHQCLVRERVLS